MNPEDNLRQQVEEIADELCRTIDGCFDFRVKIDTTDTTIEKLQLLINFMIDSMERTIAAQKQQAEELKRQVELAESASIAKATFLANMSHEIRTPLNGIIGLSSLLQETQLNSDQADFANGISLSSNNLLAIINDILDFSKIEAGKMELEETRFNLQCMIQEVCESLAARAATNKNELIFRYVPDTPKWVIADEARIRQVFINLIGNAIKFTHEGYILVSVNHREGSFQFEVEDSGVGIGEDSQTNLFEEFTQADSSTTRKYGGTGLGLSISKRIVEAMGGQIGYKSNPSGGSVFWFTMPIPLCSEQYLEAVPQRMIRDKPPRILVIDDNAVNRFVLSEQLLCWGIHCEIAKSGQEGLHLYRRWREQKTPFDIILLDYSMPEMDGINVANAVRNTGDTKTQIVMLSSINSTVSEESLIDNGFNGYLLKPVDADVIYSMLEVVCAGLDGKHTPKLITRYNLRDAKVTERAALHKSPDSFKVLVAEDNIVNQKVARSLLEKQGCVVYMANNGLEAIEQLMQFPIDLVLMDMQMPDLNGIEASKRIRDHKNKAIQNIPIVALTANATKEDRECCFEAGMNDYISKPFHPEKLRQVLEKWR